MFDVDDQVEVCINGVWVRMRVVFLTQVLEEERLVVQDAAGATFVVPSTTDHVRRSIGASA